MGIDMGFSPECARRAAMNHETTESAVDALLAESSLLSDAGEVPTVSRKRVFAAEVLTADLPRGSTEMRENGRRHRSVSRKTIQHDLAMHETLRVNEDASVRCAICVEDLEVGRAVRLPCGHGWCCLGMCVGHFGQVRHALDANTSQSPQIVVSACTFLQTWVYSENPQVRSDAFACECACEVEKVLSLILAGSVDVLITKRPMIWKSLELYAHIQVLPYLCATPHGSPFGFWIARSAVSRVRADGGGGAASHHLAAQDHGAAVGEKFRASSRVLRRSLAVSNTRLSESRCAGAWDDSAIGLPTVQARALSSLPCQPLSHRLYLRRTRRAASRAR